MRSDAQTLYSSAVVVLSFCCTISTGLEKSLLKEQSLEMFKHAYWSYMNFAYPADELMPLSCKGRYRGVTPTRGDIDDALGNFSLSLIDSLDTLVVLGMYTEFENAVSLVMRDVSFDTDVIVSVFETNIRVVGGLLGGHLMSKVLQSHQPHRLPWYSDQLLQMAKDIATRLLPAFNTTTGIPYPRINLKHGMIDKLKRSQDTCTACGGTMILEFAALSRLTGEQEFEDKARKAMDFLWQQRHRGSDLMDSGVGAGIDSYYEYCLKAYILLGDLSYLYRFNRHYEGVMKYISQGPMFVDVHMHRPTVASRTFMDALLAFWPGLQVLKGDLKPAIETHEMLYQVIQKHNFLPEAFTHDFQVHWAQHPLRPEFVESTYFLYKATKDPHYLEVGEKVMDAMNKHVRTRCGFAGVKDVRTMAHEDRMDSFVLAETFKYLYMLFAEKEDLIFDPDNYIFTTEAHFLPLSIAQSRSGDTSDTEKPVNIVSGQGNSEAEAEESSFNSCPNTKLIFSGELSSYARLLRNKLRNFVSKDTPGSSRGQRHSHCPAASPSHEGSSRLRAKDFNAANPTHVESLRRMGIELVSGSDGRIQLVHSANSATSLKDAQDGLAFMHEMIQFTQNRETEGQQALRVVQVISAPHFGLPAFIASPGQFGKDLTGSFNGISGALVLAEPLRACSELSNKNQVRGNIVLAERSECMFVDKVRNVEKAGAVGIVIIDNYQNTNAARSPLFSMSGDGKTRVKIPAVFLFREEGEELMELVLRYPTLTVRLGERPLRTNYFIKKYLRNPDRFSRKNICKMYPEIQAAVHEYYITVIEDGVRCVRSGSEVTCFTDSDLLTPIRISTKAPALPRAVEISEQLEFGQNCVESAGKIRCVERMGDREIVSVDDGSTITIESRPISTSDLHKTADVCEWDLPFPFSGQNKGRENNCGIATKNRNNRHYSPIIEVVNGVNGQRNLNFHFGQYFPIGKGAADKSGDQNRAFLISERNCLMSI